jgi:histidinol-phosphate aminotransferase
MGNASLIKYLNDVKYSFNSYTMNSPALELGSAAVEDEAYFRECCGRIMKTRDRAEESFRELGFEFEKSASNFIFVTHPKRPAAEIFKALRERHIYVRYFNKPRINNYLRVTIGTDEQMAALFAALKEILVSANKHNNEIFGEDDPDIKMISMKNPVDYL